MDEHSAPVVARALPSESTGSETFGTEPVSDKELETATAGATFERLDLVFRWIRPDGKVEQLVPVSLTGHAGERVLAHSWIKLKRSKEAALLAVADPSFGLEEFIGNWRLQLETGGERVAEVRFKVFC